MFDELVQYMKSIPDCEFDEITTLIENETMEQIINNNIPEEIKVELTQNQVRAIQERANKDKISYQVALNKVWHELFTLYCE